MLSSRFKSRWNNTTDLNKSNGTSSCYIFWMFLPTIVLHRNHRPTNWKTKWETSHWWQQKPWKTHSWKPRNWRRRKPWWHEVSFKPFSNLRTFLTLTYVIFQEILHIFFFFFSSVKIPAPPCGKEPCCAGSRKGPGCSQPDLWPFRGRISAITW